MAKSSSKKPGKPRGAAKPVRAAGRGEKRKPAAPATSPAAKGRTSRVTKAAGKPAIKGLIMKKPSRSNGQPSPKADKNTIAPKPVLPAPGPGPMPRNFNPITSDAKPKKNQAGLTSKELDVFRDLLLAKRRELVGDMSSMEREALRTGGGSNLSNLPMHMADMGTDNYEQEFTLGLMEKDRNLLREINVALAKIQDGTYGLCEGTGRPISRARLEAQPWAKYSIEHARQLEKGRMR